MDGSFAPSLSTPVRAAVTHALQHTLAHAASLTGIGVHSGKPATLTLLPAPAGSGIIFVRSDVAGDNRIAATYDLVIDTRMCTVIANAAGVSVATIEHVMAALSGCGVDNAEVHVDGPEVPIMDGSSAPFVEMIERAGLMAQDATRRSIKVLREVRIEDNGKWAVLEPATQRSYEFEIEFASKAIGRQTRSFALKDGTFGADLSNSRTFGFLHEVEQMRKMGLGRGGSLDNAVVIDGDTVMNEDGLRHADEFVRHKLLDSVGDLALAGAPIIAAFRSYKGGHALNNKLLRALFADSANWAWA